TKRPRSTRGMDPSREQPRAALAGCPEDARRRRPALRRVLRRAAIPRAVPTTVERSRHSHLRREQPAERLRGRAVGLSLYASEVVPRRQKRWGEGRLSLLRSRPARFPPREAVPQGQSFAGRLPLVP